MSDTPRTKAATRMAFTSEYMVEIEEAQKLERDLTQSKEANAGLMRACDKLERELGEVTKQRNHYKAACDQYSEDELLCKLAEVTKQRDALAEALRTASERFRNPKYGCMWDDAADDIDKTLSAVKGGSHE